MAATTAQPSTASQQYFRIVAIVSVTLGLACRAIPKALHESGLISSLLRLMTSLISLPRLISRNARTATQTSRRAIHQSAIRRPTGSDKAAPTQLQGIVTDFLDSPACEDMYCDRFICRHQLYHADGVSERVNKSHLPNSNLPRAASPPSVAGE